MNELKWGHVPVRLIMTPPQSDAVMDGVRTQVGEAIERAEKERPDALSIIPKGGFRIVVWWNCGALHITVVDLSLPSDYRLRYRSCQLGHATRSRGFDDDQTVNPYVAPLAELPDQIASEWKDWLEWRKRRRVLPEPGWLTEIKKKRT